MIAIGAAHAVALAAIHAAAFPPGERWDDAAMGALLAMPGIFGFIDQRGGFILARSAGGEAEILSLAVQPAVRRRGLARALVGRVLAVAAGMPVFLEVGVANVPARTLYETAGFSECGVRPGYYGPGRDAVVLRRGPGL